MSSNQETALFKNPFSAAYWRTAAGELKSTKMLVLTALLVALRIALKPLAIPLGPQLSIQTAMLATALGAMIYGPVIAIPSAIISDTIGFIIWPTGDYFLPFVLTEIASTMIYALFLYRAKVSPLRVMLSRFCICFFVNLILQQGIYAWQLAYLGSPEKAVDTVMGIMTVMRVFKNLAFFPIEAVVLTLFLKALLPVTQRMKVTRGQDSDLRFTKKHIIWLICLTLAGVLLGTAYLGYRYSTTSRATDYTAQQREDANRYMAELVLEQTDDWDGQTVVCVVDKAYRPLFGQETDYTVCVYILNQEVFDGKQAENEEYTMDTLWGYTKKKAGKDDALELVAQVTLTKNESSGQILDFLVKPEA